MRRLLVSMFAVLAIGACGDSVPADASGETIYTAVCARCHGIELEGGIGPQLGGSDAPSADQPEAYFVQAVARGLGRMPSYRTTLSDDQIGRVVDFILDQQDR